MLWEGRRARARARARTAACSRARACANGQFLSCWACARSQGSAHEAHPPRHELRPARNPPAPPAPPGGREGARGIRRTNQPRLRLRPWSRCLRLRLRLRPPAASTAPWLRRVARRLVRARALCLAHLERGQLRRGGRAGSETGDETSPVSTGRGTRRVHLVRGGGRGARQGRGRGGASLRFKARGGRGGKGRLEGGGRGTRRVRLVRGEGRGVSDQYQERGRGGGRAG